jgi:hypothetical protein
MAKQARRRTLRARASSSGDNASSISSSSEVSVDTDEEYMRIIAGAEDESDTDATAAAAALKKEMQDFFDRADHDGDGTLSMEEAWRIRGLVGKEGKESLSQSLLLLQRMQNLENRVQENTQKLDRILGLLQQKKKGLLSGS